MFCSRVGEERTHTDLVLKVKECVLLSAWKVKAEVPRGVSVFMCVCERERAGGESVPVCLSLSFKACELVLFSLSVPSPRTLLANETVSLWKKLSWRTPTASDQEAADLLSSQPPSTCSPSSDLSSPLRERTLRHLRAALASHGIFNDRHAPECQCRQVCQLHAVVPRVSVREWAFRLRDLTADFGKKHTTLFYLILGCDQ